MSFRKILTNGCVAYTVIILAFYTFGLMAGNTSWIPTQRIAYSLLVFAMCFSALNEAVGRVRLTFPARLGIHFAACAVLYFFIFVIGGGFHKNGGSILAALLCYLFVYAVGAVIVCVCRYLFADTVREKETAAGQAKETQKPEDYKSMFDR